MSEVMNENRPVAVKLQGVKKRYTLGQIGGGTLQNDLQSWWARVRGKEDPNLRIGQEERIVGRSFMALNGINLTVYKGEALGIIGGNGAGKSTMLKLLSRITAPTAGKIDIYGRIASMLEVGTGFNPEMTGRENVYMNGAILGMTKEEIEAKMEAIVEFSEVRDFIDTPVKRYSSGMYVKLAFSVAAHLDSEIMIMDEVLAVGDVAFQNKCLQKMKDVASQEGRTVLYVSHNMNTIRQLCDRCIVLEQGKIIFSGDVESAIEVYSKSKAVNVKSDYNFSLSQKKSIQITQIHVESPTLKMAESLFFQMVLENRKAEACINIRYVLYTAAGEAVGMIPSDNIIISEGRNVIECELDTSLLSPGVYVLNIHMHGFNGYDYNKLDSVIDTLTFEIDETVLLYNASWKRKYWGLLRFDKMKTKVIE